MRVLHVGPLPPQPTGVADYSLDLLPHLKARLDVTVSVADDAPPPPLPFLRRSEVRGSFDVALCHLGNHRFHADALAVALARPSAIVLHDAILHHLYADLFLARGRPGRYVREAAFGADRASTERAIAAATGVRPPAWYDQPMLARVVAASRGVIVHSHAAAAVVRDACGDAPVQIVHHGVAEPVATPEPAGPFAVGVFGGLTAEKRIDVVVRAIGALDGARLILAGEAAPGLPHADLATGRLELGEMERTIGRCHVCVQLRWPSAGEASGAVLRCLRQGRPTIVSDVGWFAELPDDVVMKLPAGLDPDDETRQLADALRALRDSPARRGALGQAARAYCATSGWPSAADAYRDFLQEVA